MADDEGRAAGLANELGDQREHLTGRHRVQLAGRLVGDQERRLARERGAERDPLLLAARELTGMCVAPSPEPDPFEQLVGACVASRCGHAGQPELDSDELPRGQLSGERPPVVLVGVADRARPELGRSPAAERAHVDARDPDRAGRRAVEGGDDPQQCRLPRAARAEDDAELSLLDGEAEPLQRGDAAFRRGIDAEHVLELDERAHSNTSARGGAGAENARRVASRIRPAAASA